MDVLIYALFLCNAHALSPEFSCNPVVPWSFTSYAECEAYRKGSTYMTATPTTDGSYAKCFSRPVGIWSPALGVR
jgi:hypothetical protein